MIIIKLSKADFTLLKSVVDSDVFDRLCYKTGDYDYVDMEVTAYIVDILQDQLTSKLTDVGFDSDFKINPRGIQLESLIDRLSSGLVD